MTTEPIAPADARRPVVADQNRAAEVSNCRTDRFTAPGIGCNGSTAASACVTACPPPRRGGAAVEAEAVLRADRVRAYGRQAGFASCTELPIEHDLRRLHRLAPG